MEKHLYDYMKEICYISGKACNDLRIAKDMFINNIDDAGKEVDMYPYPVSGEVDYVALKPIRDDLNKESAVMSVVFGKYAPDIVALYNHKQYDAMIEFTKEKYEEQISANKVAEGVDGDDQ